MDNCIGHRRWQGELAVQDVVFGIRQFRLCCIWAVAMCSVGGNALAETKKRVVMPVMRYQASVADGEYESVQAADAAIQAAWDFTTATISRAAINLHPWQTDRYQNYNGVPHYHVTDSYVCSANSGCQTTPDAGPYVTTLVPKCPTEKYQINGKTYQYWLRDVTSSPASLDKQFRCVLEVPKAEPPPKSCPIGNPVHPSTGKKVLSEIDYPGIGNSLTFRRMYGSEIGKFASILDNLLVNNAAAAVTPPRCLSSWYVENTAGQPLREYCFPVTYMEAEQTIIVSTDTGRDLVFYGPAFEPRSNENHSLTYRTTESGASQWLITDAESRIDVYDERGLLIGRTSLTGATISLTYSDTALPMMLEMQDSFGRRVQFAYDGKARLARLADPAGSEYTYTHDLAGNLVSVSYPDGHARRYLYNETPRINAGSGCSSSPGGFPHALTGIIEDDVRFGNFDYSCDGKVVSSELAGGRNRYTFSYSGGVTEVTDPLNAKRQMTYSNILDSLQLIGSDQPAGSGCDAASQAISYDANGNPSSTDDFVGNRVCQIHNLARNLETVRVQSLSKAQTCSAVTGTGAALPAGSGKTSTQWHPDWRLKTKVAEPGRITSYVYNGQPNPFAGGTVASCAPADALLPDGKPIAVLCRQVEQATTDANGSQGFNATLQSGVAAREERWTYNRWGQVLTHDGPRTDVNDITTYVYYSDTSFTGSGAEAAGHTQGDLQSVTNAAGQVTQNTKYNKHGQLLESIGPNGVVITHTYDLRQRLLSTTEAGQTTTYTYDAAGQLTRITWSDASYLGYEYDPAHRQTAVFDHLGNRIEYTLDNAGNRIAENVKDPGGLLSRQLSRSVDALGRVQQTTGRE